MRDQAGTLGGIAQGPWTDLALHTLGWKAFQDLSACVCEEILHRPIEIYREAQDGGQDAAFFSKMTVTNEEILEGTIQCKFSSDSSRAFKLSDITEEIQNIEALKANGHADFYVLITNMSVDGRVAADFKLRMRGLGVRYPHIFGKQFLTWSIRRSPRLRALVPRVYGLGDLSTILDERSAAQTQALLGHLLPTLNVYVPTDSHTAAVKTLDKHGIVLLLGAPATGKSTIAAILATLASDSSKHRCFKSDGPIDLLNHWNPNEKGAFYWIDDAFGPNQLREDFVDTWTSIMSKVQAAVVGGSNFVLTSRRHIYEEAKHKLGTRNHPLFRNGKAIIDVGGITTRQREQILYNHVKGGDQSPIWKSSVKPLLPKIAKLDEFLPEVARRLGDTDYTQHLQLSQGALEDFFRNPQDHLIQVLNEMSKAHRAALVLVFLHRSRMLVGARDEAMEKRILRHFDVDRETLSAAIDHMRGSFLVEKSEGEERFLAFTHPTFADAISAILQTAEMIELYLHGTKIDVLIENIVCEGADTIEDAIIVPDRFRPLLVNRLKEIPNDYSANNSLFAFLATRASVEVFRDAVAALPQIFSRKSHWSWNSQQTSKVQAFARALKLGVLPDANREEMSIQLESSLLEDLDTSFVSDDYLLALIRPTRLLKLFVPLKAQLADRIKSRAKEIAEDADLDTEPSDNFDELTQAIDAIEELFDSDESMSEPLSESRSAIETAVERIEERRQEYSGRDEDWDWGDRVRTSTTENQTVATASPQYAVLRSIFSDVDK